MYFLSSLNIKILNYWIAVINILLYISYFLCFLLFHYIIHSNLNALKQEFIKYYYINSSYYKHFFLDHFDIKININSSNQIVIKFHWINNSYFEHYLLDYFMINLILKRLIYQVTILNIILTTVSFLDVPLNYFSTYLNLI